MFKLAVGVAIAGGAATGAYLYLRMDNEIRQHVATYLAERYPDLRVSVGGARLVEGRGIAVYDIALSDPALEPGAAPLLAVDELLLVCQAKLPQLVCGALTVDRVEVKHPRLAVRRLGDGRWNVASLAPAGACDQPPPQVVVTHGELSISDTALRQAPPVVLRDIHLTVTPAASPPGEAPKFRIDGAMGGPHVRRLEVRATLAGTGSAGSASLSVEQFQMTSALLAWARPQLPAAINQIRVEAMLDGQAALQWFADGRPPRVDAELAVSEGRVDDALLPAPITELAGQIVVAGDQLQVRNMRGKCGAAEVGAAVNRSGWAPRAPLAAVLTATDAVLDDALYQSLRRFDAAGLAVAGELVEQWDRFDPAGVVDGTLQVTFDSQRWTPTALLTGRQLSFQSEKFPYRLTEGTGVIRYTPPTATAPDLVDVEMTARGGGQPLRIVGQVIDPQPGAAGWAQITGEALDIEQRMIAAIASEKCRDVISELHPSGRFNVNWRIERATPGAEPRTALRLDLTDVRINYDRFPYPLRGIRGTMTAQDDLWTFTDLVSGGRRPVRGSGTLRPVDGGVEMSLRISGEQTSLDVALYDALPEAARRAWTELNPRGEVDFASEIAYRPGQARPSLHVAIRPRPESTQIKPAFFPYLMDNVSGTITFRDGEVLLADMRAQHDRTTIRTNGHGFFWPEGHWQFRLTGLTADKLSPRTDLTSALPRQLNKLVERLRPTGSFSIHDGAIEFCRRSASEIAPLEANWDVAIDCHQANLACGIDLRNIFGTVRLRGETDGARSWSAGELQLDSVTFQDVQFTNIRGPLYVNETKCLLGKWATDQQQQPERRVTGNVYDGSLAANAWVTFDNLPEYRAEVRVQGADLRRIVVERFGRSADYAGKVDADVRLGGRSTQLDLLVGEGDVHIRDANLYELSLLASLLKMLRTGEANKTAFTHSDVAFRLQGRHIYLDKIDFLGDVVNLYGSGETNFDQQLALKFSAVVGRHDYRLPMVKTLMREANQQILQMYVNGTLAQPEVTTEAFPGLAQMFNQIGQDLRRPAAAIPRLQAQPPGRVAVQPAARQ